MPSPTNPVRMRGANLLAAAMILATAAIALPATLRRSLTWDRGLETSTRPSR